MSELHIYLFFFNLRLHVFHMQFCCFRIGHGSARNYCAFEKTISYFMNIMYKRIFLNLGVISFINEELFSLFQLHTYKFGLVYMRRHPSKGTISSYRVDIEFYQRTRCFAFIP